MVPHGLRPAGVWLDCEGTPEPGVANYGRGDEVYERGKSSMHENRSGGIRRDVHGGEGGVEGHGVSVES